MLPRIATSVQMPPPQEQGEAGAGARPAPSPEALANLRAALLLRLIEAMMRQFEQGGGDLGDNGSGTRQLLELLFAAMKELPAGGGRSNEAWRRLTAILSRVPAEMRPAIERLLTAAISTAPTKVLMEALRSPQGPQAQRLAQALLSAGDRASGSPAVAGAGQRVSAVNAQWLVSASVARQDAGSPTGRGASGEERSVQSALRRLFEGGSGARPREAEPTDGVAGAPRPAQETARPVLLPDSRVDGAVEPRRQAEGSQPANRPQVHLADRGGSAPAGPADSESARGERAAGVEPKILTGEARVKQDVLRLIARTISSLTEDDVLILRLLLQAPLSELPSEASEPRRSAAGTQPGQPSASHPGARDAGASAQPGAGMPAQVAADARPTAAPSPQPGVDTMPADVADRGDDAPVRIAANAGALPERAAERPMPAPMLREGLAAAFVPYLPAQEELEANDRPAREEADEEELSEEAGDGGADERDAEEEPADQQQAAEADPDLARRRRKLEELAGPPDPGFVFYQRLGDYWT